MKQKNKTNRCKTTKKENKVLNRIIIPSIIKLELLGGLK